MKFSEYLLENYKHLDYNIEDEGMFKAAYFGKDALRFRKKKFSDLNDGDWFYEIHLDITPENQGKGLGAEMVKSFLYREGGTAYVSKGRITNQNALGVIKKIKADPNFEVEEDERGFLIREK